VSVERVSQLEAWVGKMAISDPERTLLFDYLADLREQVTADGCTVQTRRAVGQAAIFLGLYSRPVGLQKTDIVAMLDAHKADCAGRKRPGGAESDAVEVQGVLAAVARACGVPVAWITTILALREAGLLTVLAEWIGGR
jgi:hypothetical protein